MPEYIEREAHCKKCIKYDICKWHESMLSEAFVSFFPHNEGCSFFIPAADVEVVRHGVWVSADNDGEWKCSLCGGEIVVDAYGDIHPLDDCGWIGCPYCLAKMDGKGEGDG